MHIDTLCAQLGDGPYELLHALARVGPAHDADYKLISRKFQFFPGLRLVRCPYLKLLQVQAEVYHMHFAMCDVGPLLHHIGV